MRSILLVLLFFIAYLPEAHAQTEAPKPAQKEEGQEAVVGPDFVAGAWTGVGSQENGSSWSIILTADPANGDFAISYPSLACGGHWTLDKHDATRAWFVEKITYGLNNCIDNSLVGVTLLSREYLTITYFYPDGDLAAWSTLTKMEEE